MPLIQPSNETKITILDDEGTVIFDIDPISALFWGRNMMLNLGFEVYMLEGGFREFDEGDFLHFREDGVSRFKEGDGGYKGEEVTGNSGRKRKRKEDGRRPGRSTGFAEVVDGGEGTNGKRRSQDESQESSSGFDSENMSSIDDGSEQSEFMREDGANGSPSAKMGMGDVRGRVTETEAEQDVQ